MIPPRNSDRQSSTRDPAHPAPRRRFGQNFLVNPQAIARIVAAAAPAPGETVVEIGPGRGALTEALLESLPRLVAIEIDRDLVDALRSRFPDDRLHVVSSDVLDVKLASLGGALVVVGNLPYNVSKPVAMKLVSERAAIARAVLMFQKEVALRLTAAPGTASYGPLTVLAGRAFRIERLFDVAPGSFRPSPKVVSTVTRWIPRDRNDLPEPLEAPLKATLRAAFAQRRRTLLTNLRASLPGGEAQARDLLERVGLDAGLRAESVPPDALVALARLWPTIGG